MDFKQLESFVAVVDEGSFSNELASLVLNDQDVQGVLIDNVLNTLEAKGYSGLDVDFEFVFPQDAAAYASFPRGGVYIAPRTYTKVVADDGVTVLLDNEQESSIAMKDSTAWYINYMLRNAMINGTGTYARFDGMTMAGKTGTTSSRKDLYFAGYTKSEAKRS